ncbi:MAG: TlpA family protein disulfide reductase [Bdellovibrionales bacterium]
MKSRPNGLPGFHRFRFVTIVAAVTCLILLTKAEPLHASPSSAPDIPSNIVQTVSNALVEHLTTLDGAAFQAKNQRMLVYYWATWCVNCLPKLRTELPAMAIPEGGEIVTVNTDKDIDRAKHFVDEESLKLTVLRDEGKQLSTPLKAHAVPFWAVLEREGDHWKVLHARSGGTAEDMRAAFWK